MALRLQQCVNASDSSLLWLARSLLADLGKHMSDGEPKTGTLAPHDQFFLTFNSGRVSQFKDIDNLRHIYDLTTSLLEKMSTFANGTAYQAWPLEWWALQSDNIEYRNFGAKFDRVVRRLQQAALEALIYQGSKFLADSAKNWHQHWIQERRWNSGWFSEWPNSRRPLSTTWPWNIRPSLVVLWGVCWMFYDNSTRSAQELRQQLEDEELASSSWTRVAPQSATPSQRKPQQTKDTLSSRLTDSIKAENVISWATRNNDTLFPEAAWLQLGGGGGVNARRANGTPDYTHALSGYRPAHATDFSPYISSYPVVSPDPPPNAPLAWPENPGSYSLAVLPRNPGSNPQLPFLPSHRHSAPSSAATLSPDFNVWQDPLGRQPQHSQQPQHSHLTPQRSLPSARLQPYASSSQQAASQGDNGAAAAFSPSLRLPGGQMQTYPSPHSDVSRDETRSSCFSLLPGHDMSPNMMLAASPSIESHHSHPSAGRKTEEPPRNVEGQITCVHPKCVRDPPVFSRRCEWTKHMDKHTRPYVCNLPGCEKVRGFTYSGGLSRHQREVHRQYGGPKASFMCPHKDCKRSTGLGFSRRENLQEHLRRVHRQVGDAEADKQTATEVTSPVPAEPKRRRRRVDDDDDDDEDDDNETEPALGGTRKRRKNNNDSDGEDIDSDQNQNKGLLAEVKRLRNELQEKDERLRKLEQTVELLVKRIG
ncbi:MAG: hypothetical protein Q9216_001416 [Gyalolechia sp. 2 TL-2023]